MKKLFLIIQLVILIDSQVFSQTEWEYIGLADPNIGDIFDIEIDVNGNIYAGTLLGPFYKSSDNGVTWELKNNGLPANAAIGQDIANKNNLIYLVTDQGLYRSTNGGDNWFRIAQTIPFLYFDQVSIIANGYIFASVSNLMGTGGVFRSIDDGVTWEQSGYTGIGAVDIGINSSGVMFLGNLTASWYGIQRSFDLGITWNWIYPLMATSALEYLRDSSVLAGVTEIPSTQEGGIFKTTNNGDTWFNTNTFSGLNFYSDFVLDKNNDIYVSVTGSGVYLSTNSGVTWSIKGLSNVDVLCLAIDSAGFLYAGTHTNGIFRTPGRTTPVELISFTAIVNERDVELSWITATELNNTGFEILRGVYTERNRRAQNDNEWKSIGFVPGYGTSTEKRFYTFSDEILVEGKYKYRLKQIDFDGTSTYSEIVEVEIISPEQFVLEQNYPNPFNPSTKIKYSIPNVIAIRQLPEKQSQFVVLSVYDILGNEVTTLVNEEKSAGTYEVEFNAGNFPSGVYFYQLKAGEFISTKKMILLK